MKKESFDDGSARRGQPPAFAVAPEPSLWVPLSCLLVAVALIEIAVEVGMSRLGPISFSGHVVVDSATTFLAILPFIYLFLVRPQRLHHEEHVRNQQEILHLSRQMIRAVEAERKKLSSDLHDDFGQILTALQFGVETLKNALPKDAENSEKCWQQCEYLSGLITQLGDRVRLISSGLRPLVLDELGLVPALDWLVRDFSRQNLKCQFVFKHDAIDDRFPPEIELALFRICQETLNNVVKHSGADSVNIEMSCSQGALRLKIEDNGIGFESDRRRQAGERQRGIGMLGMRERAAVLGGRLDVVSSPGEGTCVIAKIPTLLRRKEDALYQGFTG